MKIQKIEVRPVRLPMPQPHTTASGVLSESPLVLTDISTDDGIVGRSIIFTYSVAALGPTADLIRNIAPLIAGEAVAPIEVERKLSQRFRLLGTQGLVGMALAAIDMALWDALARAHGVPLCALLGGEPKAIPAYGAVGFDGEAGAARIAEDWAKRGFQGVKAKIGYPTVEEDLAVIRAIRRAVGEDIAVMVDYNQSLTPVEAIERLRRLEGEGLTWIEEPVHSHDFAGSARVAREIATPIQSGENWWGPMDVGHALEAGASDYVMLDAMKIGGVTGWMRAAALAAGRGVRVSNHLWPEISAHLLSVTQNAHWLEYADWWNPVLENPLVIENGRAIPGGPIEWARRVDGLLHV